MAYEAYMTLRLTVGRTSHDWLGQHCVGHCLVKCFTSAWHESIKKIIDRCIVECVYAIVLIVWRSKILVRKSDFQLRTPGFYYSCCRFEIAKPRRHLNQTKDLDQYEIDKCHYTFPRNVIRYSTEGMRSRVKSQQVQTDESEIQHW